MPGLKFLPINMKRVAIILVNWNGKDDTLACLASLKSLITYHVSRITIVVDNGSTDGSVVAIRNKFQNVDVIETGQNLGFTGGNNIGIRMALERGADFVWLLNNDTIVNRDALEALIASFTKEDIGIAGSKIYFAKGAEYHKDSYRPDQLGKVLWYGGGVIDWGNMYALHRGVDEVDRGQYDTTEETPFVTGCSMMIRKEVIDTVGILDKKLFLYFEDVDFCLRAKRHGWQCVYVPKSIIWHVNASSSGSPGSDIHQYYQTRNRLILGMRYAPIRTKVALIREGFQFILKGPVVRRNAVMDAMMWRFGRRM